VKINKLIVITLLFFFAAILQSCKKPEEKAALPTLTVATAPYQDLAMLVNAPELKLDVKAGITLKLVTMAWEDILLSVASAGKTVDVGFGSYVEYLTKFSKLNDGATDPIIYIQPLYVYKGGGFIALSNKISPFRSTELSDKAVMQRLKRYRIGAQKQSLYDMMIYSIALRAGINPKDLNVFDTPMNDAILALETKSLDLAAAGLPQVAEARKRGGQLAISMEDAGFADITGFICRESTLKEKRPQIEALIRVWFQCVDFVYADLKKNSVHSLNYLLKTAATKYTYDEYAQALSQEYLPRNLEDLRKNVLASGSKYDFSRIGNTINEYLINNGFIKKQSPIPAPLLGQL
jgi:ABC-type nitrate/sulfonate/bicarbonate transport system substrate-binding protein